MRDGDGMLRSKNSNEGWLPEPDILVCLCCPYSQIKSVATEIGGWVGHPLDPSSSIDMQTNATCSTH
jgi:hypothetical protein